MKLSILFLAVVSLYGQAPTTPALSSLPAYTIGFGPTWTRGATAPYALDVTVAKRINEGKWYWWSDIATPITKAAPGSATASSLTTGMAWIPEQNPSGTISLVFIIQGGLTSQAASTIEPSFSGSGGIAFRIRPHLYLMPYLKAANASTSGSGALATAVIQPGIQLLYGFGGK